MPDSKLSTKQDDAADKVIASMIAGCIGGAVVPAAINWTVVAGALGVGVVAIGKCYGTQLTKDEAWKLIVQFIRGAGLAWAGIALGSKLLSIIISFTGIGYAGAVAIDAAMSAAIAYAVGACAKAYFKGERDKKELGRLFRSSFEEKKKNK